MQRDRTELVNKGTKTSTLSVRGRERRGEGSEGKTGEGKGWEGGLQRGGRGRKR